MPKRPRDEDTPSRKYPPKVRNITGEWDGSRSWAERLRALRVPESDLDSLSNEHNPSGDRCPVCCSVWCNYPPCDTWINWVADWEKELDEAWERYFGQDSTLSQSFSTEEQESDIGFNRELIGDAFDESLISYYLDDDSFIEDDSELSPWDCDWGSQDYTPLDDDSEFTPLKREREVIDLTKSIN